MQETRGVHNAVSDLKSAKLSFTRLLAGKPLKGRVETPISKRDLLPKVIPQDIRQRLKDCKDPHLIK